MKNASRIGTGLAWIGLMMAGLAHAHGSAVHTQKATKDSSQAEEQAFGRPADPQSATRTILVEMSDAMRFVPSEIRVKRGEAVRFLIRNTGRLLHEMVLGTEEGLREHAEQMKTFPGMEHDEPYMTHVPPGKQGEIAWRFTRPGVFHYGCLIPGHFEAGMVGKIVVE